MIPEFILKTLIFRLDSFVTLFFLFIEPYVTQIITGAEHASAADSAIWTLDLTHYCTLCKCWVRTKEG
jgi:hypothetical protein